MPWAEHLSAAYGHSSSGIVIKAFILDDFFHHLLRSHFSCHSLETLSIAKIHTLQTVVAYVPVDMYPCILSHIYALLGQWERAISALYAAIGHLYHLLVERYQFGVMAPFTIERTALEKNCRSYSRAVLCAELLYGAH